MVTKEIENLTESIIEEAKESKRKLLQKQVDKGLAWMSKDLDARVEAEFNYLSKDETNYGFIITLPCNSPDRRNAQGRKFDQDSELTYEVRFLPLNTNFSQPGFASRMLNKGARFVKIVNPSRVDAFMAGVRTQSPDSDELSGYEQNFSVLRNDGKVRAELDRKEAEIAELKAVVESLKGAKK